MAARISEPATTCAEAKTADLPPQALPPSACSISSVPAPPPALSESKSAASPSSSTSSCSSSSSTASTSLNTATAQPAAPRGLEPDSIFWHGTIGATIGSTDAWDPPQLVAASTAEARPGYDAFTASEYLDTPRTLKAKVNLLAHMLRRKATMRATVAYTGAGISTSTGIGDYASRAKKSVAPHRRSSWRGGGGSGNRLDARPSKSHHVLAALHEAKLLHHWLQQNHDRLAQKAGYPQRALNEIHGAWGDDKNQVKMMDDVLRPDLDAWMEAWEEKAECVLALGTSLCGMRADCVAEACAERAATGGSTGTGGLVIVNLQRTQLDGRSSLRIWGLLDEVMPLLAKCLKVKSPNARARARGKEWTSRHPGCKYRTPKRTARDSL